MDVVLGTAGHIDHGKTSLVRALTGINCDRLEEERRRGITIELGFAWLDLPDGRRLGIVDVPGHERFVKAMVAGASGIDCVLLVIAADEGVMPQTREHLDICAMLGVKSGIIALTKTDMVEPDWLEMAREDARGAVAGTFMQDAPLIEVSSTTGHGIAELKKAIHNMVGKIKPQIGTDIFRLPVDRVFTMKGHGTVVTGTVISGSCNIGEDMRVFPEDKIARIRGLQSHGAPIRLGRRGMRCAINLQGLDVEEIERGDVIARPDTLFPANRWIVKITCLPSSPRPLRQRMEAHFHHGAAECPCGIVFKNIGELAPGDSAIAEIHLAKAMAGVFGDRCVLRANAPLRAIAGAILIDPLPYPLRKRDPRFNKKMETYLELGSMAASCYPPDPQRLTVTALSLREAPGADKNTLAVLTGLPGALLDQALQIAQDQDQAICWDESAKSFIARDIFDDCITKCVKRAEDLHQREPLKTSFAPTALAAGWGDTLPPRFIQKALETAQQHGLLQAFGNGLKLAAHNVIHDPQQSELLQRLKTLFEAGAYTPPFLKEIEEEMGANAKKARQLINYLREIGELVKIQEGVYYHKAAIENILARVRAWFATHESLEIGDMRSILGVSRKYAVPLLEYMDSIHMTARVGNGRKLINDAAC